ncbi:MAG: hypothetical protein QM831_09390 [Kofleriaceae bacterium]
MRNRDRRDRFRNGFGRNRASTLRDRGHEQHPIHGGQSFCGSPLLIQCRHAEFLAYVRLRQNRVAPETTRHQDAREVKSRWIFVAIAIVSATLFAAAAWGGQWFTWTQATFGPMGSFRCFGDDCRDSNLIWVSQNEQWLRLATATWAGCLVTSFVELGLAAGIAANRGWPKRLAGATTTSLLATIAASSLWIMKVPDMPDMGYGRGFYEVIIAMVLCAITPVWVLVGSRQPAKI